MKQNIDKYEILLGTTCICTKIEENSSLRIWTHEYRVGETYKCEYVKYRDKEWQLKYGPKTDVRVYGREMGQEHPCYFNSDSFRNYFILTGEHRERKINKLFENEINIK